MTSVPVNISGCEFLEGNEGHVQGFGLILQSLLSSVVLL